MCRSLNVLISIDIDRGHHRNLKAARVLGSKRQHFSSAAAYRRHTCISKLHCDLEQRVSRHEMIGLRPLLRENPLRLTSNWCTCARRAFSIRSDLQTHPLRAPLRSHFKPRTSRTTTSRFVSYLTQDLDSFASRTAPLGSLGRSLDNLEQPAKHFSDVSSRAVAYWLLGSAASVFGIVVFGGLTRLTESGYTHPASSYDIQS